MSIMMLSLLLILGLLLGAARSATNEKPPNFVLLFMDDLGYGDLGFTGHPTTSTPNLNKLAWNGKILTTWYSGCNVCSGSRASLMTGRQFPRTGVPGVFRPTTRDGLNTNETTIAEQLKKKGYATAIVGKWHLGQRQVYLPVNRGFDYYLGIPYSDDMGDGIASTCPVEEGGDGHSFTANKKEQESSGATTSAGWSKEQYEALGLLNAVNHNSIEQGDANDADPAAKFLPLVYQELNQTHILEQPLDFTTLAQKYNDFAMKFLETHQDDPFFLYMPFSHVHTTSRSQPDRQYAGCNHKKTTRRGPFGDALAESDWIIGNVADKLQELGLDENTLILFTSDNGPWLVQSASGGSEGLFTGRSSGYWDTGKGSNWEGGIREPAFAYWKGKIEPFSRSAEIISSMDVFPTLSKLAGIDLPSDRVFDGRDATDVLLKDGGKSKHDFLFFYGTCNPGSSYSVTAVRHGPYKAHWCTAPGLGQSSDKNLTKHYDPPLLFNVEVDPSEAIPLNAKNENPTNPDELAAMKRIQKAYAMEKATFEFGTIIPMPDGPKEGPNQYGVCCDRSKGCNCINSPMEQQNVGIFNLGTRAHHDRYHSALGEEEPSPPRTRAQVMLQEGNLDH